MSSQERIPQTLTTMEACFTLRQDKALLEEFWKHQDRMGPIAAAAPGFLGVIGGPIRRSNWLYFSGKWSTPKLMDEWQSSPKHKPMQTAAHSRWFTSIYIRKWRLPESGEKIIGPVFCETSIACKEPLADQVVDDILDTIVGPSLERFPPLPFETLTGQFEFQPYQFVGPLQEFPSLAPARYLLLTHWATEELLKKWLESDSVAKLAKHGEGPQCL